MAKIQLLHFKANYLEAVAAASGVICTPTLHAHLWPHQLLPPNCPAEVMIHTSRHLRVAKAQAASFPAKFAIVNCEKPTFATVMFCSVQYSECASNNLILPGIRADGSPKTLGQLTCPPRSMLGNMLRSFEFIYF